MTGTNTFTSADLVAVTPELWTGVVLEKYFAKTVAANFFLDLSSLGQGGDIVHLANIFTNSFSSSTKSVGSEVTLVSPTQTDVTITVDTWNHVAYLIEDFQMGQTAMVFEIMQRYAEQAGATLADALEDSLLGLWSGLSQTSGTTSAATTDLQIRQAIRVLDANDVPQTDRAWFMHPRVFWDQIAAAQKYYDASQAGWTDSGAASSLQRSGNFGPFDRARGLRGVLYGDPLFLSTNVVSNLTAYRQIYAHRDAFAFVVQTPGGQRVRLQSKYVLENLGTLVVADTIYGVAEIRDANAVLLNSSTTATTA